MKEEPKNTTIYIVVEKEIFKGSDAEEEERTVETKLVIRKEPALPGEGYGGGGGGYGGGRDGGYGGGGRSYGNLLMYNNFLMKQLCQ